MNKKTDYEAPTIVDINGYGVSGDISGQSHDQDRGICRPLGGAPYTACHVGTDVGQGSCSPTGAIPEASGCSLGEYVAEDPQCKSGSNALVGCKSGSHA